MQKARNSNSDFSFRDLKSGSNRKQFLQFETILFRLLEKEAEKSNKRVLANYTYKSSETTTIKEYEVVAPDGLFDLEGFTAFEVKLFETLDVFREYAQRESSKFFFYVPNEVRNVVIVVPISIPTQEKEQFQESIQSSSTNIRIWDSADIQSLISKNKRLYNEITGNLDSIVFQTTIDRSLQEDEDWRQKQKASISMLLQKFKSDELSLFLGAGVSVGAKIPSWKKLISDLHIFLLKNQLQKKSIEISDADTVQIIDHLSGNGDSNPLLQVRYIKKGLGPDFNSVLTTVMYRDARPSSRLIDAISRLSQPVRSKIGVRAIITYNFDDLVEKNLGTKHRSIYRDSDRVGADEIGVYHVHGFLPRERDAYDGLEQVNLIFSEEDYHEVMLDSYNWSNLTQLNFLRETTCLFIGLSMTDQNLRRLLHIASRKRGSYECPHFAIMKRNDIIPSVGANVSNIQKFNLLDHGIQEEVLRELGVNVVWVDDFDEIPEILDQIRA